MSPSSVPAASSSRVSAVLIPVGVVVNLSIGAVVQFIKLPVFLDSIGTVLVAMLAGPVPAILTGLVTVFVGGFTTNPVLPWFFGTAIVIGWFSGWCANRGFCRHLWQWALCGLAQGVLAAAASAPVIVALFGGITASGSSFLVAYLHKTGETLLNSVLLAGLACDPMDKLATFLIAWVVVQGFPTSVLLRFRNGHMFQTRGEPENGSE